MNVKENLKSMMTLDDAWNNQDWETFKKRHTANVAVYWPGQPEPTRGREEHYKESVEFFKTFDNKLVNNLTRFFLAMAITPVRSLTGRQR